MRTPALLLLTASLATTACGASSMHRAPAAAMSGGAAPAAQPATTTADESPLRAPSEEPAAPPGASQASQAPARALFGVDAPAQVAAPDARLPMLIYTGNLELAVLDTAAALADAEKLAAEHGGYLARRDDRSITLRVPVARFGDAVARAAALGDVVRRDVSAADVTEEFADLEVRIKNARAVRDRLEQLLAKSTTIQDSINLERELARVTSDLERLQGRVKLLRDRAAFSTLTLRFSPKKTDAPPAAPGRPRLPLPWVESLGLGRLLSL
ncbi:MAG: DUF4349 domain-containing protein [Polyangiaceae bacterium]|nr:DUF4349 domain-containing protein [Polyangiaceae bacterium]